MLANLPYVRDDQIETQTNVAAELAWEPRRALSGGADGLAVIPRFLGMAGAKLALNSVVLMEIAWDQGPDVSRLAQDHIPGRHVATLRDWAGLNRIVAVGPHDVVDRLARWHTADLPTHILEAETR